MKNLKKSGWKCKVCGFIYEDRKKPKSCSICGSDEFEEIIIDKTTDIEKFEIPIKKQKYRTIHKKGFTRKYKKLK